MKYKVTFYQCGVEGFTPELYRTKRKAEREAADFLAGFRGMPGHRRDGSIRRDGYARIVDYSGGTEAMAEVHTIGG